MSNSFLPKSFANKFTTINPAALVQSCAAHQFPNLSDGECVKPSFVRLSRETALTGMGGKASAHSFVESLFWYVSKFAYGANLDSLQKGLPPIAQFALVAACDPIKQGAGVTLADLIATCSIALGKTLALPIKTVEKAALSGPTVAGPTVAGPTVAGPTVAGPTVAGPTVADLVRIAADAPIDTRSQVPHRLTLEEKAECDASLDAAAAAKAAADAAAAKAAADAAAAAFENRIAAQRRDNEARTVAFCRLASELGITLTKGQLAMLDKLEKAADAAAA
jgi:hypothetical protein